MRPEDVWPVADLQPASWLVAALDGGRPGEVCTVVPDSFEAYVEIVLSDDDPTFWKVRDLLGRTTRAEQRTWVALMDAWPVPPAWREAPMFRTPEGDLMLFAGTFEDIEVIAIELACAETALSTMEVDRGPDGIAARLRAQRSHVPPSLWWPEDRAWVLAGEIDSDALYLGCSGTLAAEVVSQEGLESRIVSPSDPVRVESSR